MNSTRGRPDTATDESLSTAVITAIAEHEGVDPTALDVPLYEVIDPDALDALFSDQRGVSGSTSAYLTFWYNGYEVHVTSDGNVRLSDSGDP